MVMPKKGGLLTHEEEHQIFSYILAGILYSKGIPSERLNFDYLGDIEADIVERLEVASLQPGMPQYFGSEKNGFYSFKSPSGKIFSISPTNDYVMKVIFTTKIGKFLALAEISLSENGKNNLDGFMEIPIELRNFTYPEKTRSKRILKMPKYSNSVLLIESDVDYVTRLPWVFDSDTLVADSLKEILLSHYVDNIEF